MIDARSDYRATKAAGINRAAGGTKRRVLESRITIFCHHQSLSLSSLSPSLSRHGLPQHSMGRRGERGVRKQAIYRHPHCIDFFPTFFCRQWTNSLYITPNPLSTLSDLNLNHPKRGRLRQTSIILCKKQGAFQTRLSVCFAVLPSAAHVLKGVLF